ncbi:unnamed protein product [Lepeophtheirus salmonis]|uniref:(salmon louse) hypothetical protein n=1 Tax=Lepeophtheirus salmonis TaxID=72036 RepID=A0A7R8H7D5_LEPSM|nr:unnamed protein product [Lepeophtheirus salmonis]CAF2906069.1 unnamed protein product [Lepeophtheirus salmonis]
MTRCDKQQSDEFIQNFLMSDNTVMTSQSYEGIRLLLDNRRALLFDAFSAKSRVLGAVGIGAKELGICFPSIGDILIAISTTTTTTTKSTFQIHNMSNLCNQVHTITMAGHKKDRRNDLLQPSPPYLQNPSQTYPYMELSPGSNQSSFEIPHEGGVENIQANPVQNAEYYVNNPYWNNGGYPGTPAMNNYVESYNTNGIPYNMSVPQVHNGYPHNISNDNIMIPQPTAEVHVPHSPNIQQQGFQENKRPQLKRKLPRKKRAPPNENIPYVDRIENQKFICEFGGCGFEANRISNINRHIEAMHNPHYIICCQQLYPTKTHFEAHRLLIHSEGMFKCPIKGCNRTFNRKSLLHTHEDNFHPLESRSSIFCCECRTELLHPELDEEAVKNHATTHSSLV